MGHWLGRLGGVINPPLTWVGVLPPPYLACTSVQQSERCTIVQSNTGVLPVTTPLSCMYFCIVSYCTSQHSTYYSVIPCVTTPLSLVLLYYSVLPPPYLTCTVA